MLTNIAYLPKVDQFGGLLEEYCDFKRAKFAILPIPYEATVSYRGGAKEGPKTIIEASQYIELYDEELENEPYKAGIYTFPAVEPITSGPEHMIERIQQTAERIISEGKFLVALGGEHSISIGILKALKKTHPELGVIYLDAHADLRDEYWGSKYSHACVLRRIIEIFPKAVHLGLRSLSKEEAEYIRKKKLSVFSSIEIKSRISKILNFLKKFEEKVYISIDLDVFDPSVMPAVGTPEPGGLSWYEIITILSYICRNKKVIGFDIVELAPLPGNVISEFTTAKLIYKLLGYIISAERKKNEETKKTKK